MRLRHVLLGSLTGMSAGLALASSHLATVDLREHLQACREKDNQACEKVFQMLRSETAGVWGSDDRRDLAEGTKGVPASATDGLHEWFPNRYKRVLCGSLRRFASNCWLGGRITGECDLNNFVEPSGKTWRYISSFYECPPSRIARQRRSRGAPIVPCHRPTDLVEVEITPPPKLRRYLQDRMGWRPGHSWWFRFVHNDRFCAYGPWVLDSGHGNQPEIHPTQLFWWSGASKGNLEGGPWYLFAVQDASERYSRLDSFLLDEAPDTDWKPWAAAPLTNEFVVAVSWACDTKPTFTLATLDQPEAELKSCDDGWAILRSPASLPSCKECKLDVELLRRWHKGRKIHGLLRVAATVGSAREWRESGLGLKLSVSTSPREGNRGCGETVARTMSQPVPTSALDGTAGQPDGDRSFSSSPERHWIAADLMWEATKWEDKEIPTVAGLWRAFEEKLCPNNRCRASDFTFEGVVVARGLSLEIDPFVVGLPFDDMWDRHLREDGKIEDCQLTWCTDPDPTTVASPLKPARLRYDCTKLLALNEATRVTMPEQGPYVWLEAEVELRAGRGDQVRSADCRWLVSPYAFSVKQNFADDVIKDGVSEFPKDALEDLVIRIAEDGIATLDELDFLLTRLRAPQPPGTTLPTAACTPK